jgi:serralysin
VTVNAVDDRSVAVADMGAAIESGTVLINALNNDTDIDDFLDTITTVAGQAIVVGGVVTLASGATVTLTLDGQLLYDPNGAFDYLAAPTSGTALTTATDSFTYGLSGGASAQVDIALTGATSAEDILRGDGNANALVPTLAGQTLQGMAGADTLNDANLAVMLQGGAGDDLYFIDSSGTTMLELTDEGTDTVRTTRANLTLAAHVENLTYVGPNARFYGYGNSQNNIIDGGALGDFLYGYEGQDTLRGGAGNDVLNGGNGHDVLDGGTGGDAMIGGAGNDVYYVDSVNDQIIEGASQGHDLISTTLTSYVIPNWVENLSFSGIAAYTGTGNAVGNEIAGSISGDTLNGLGGNDRLIGFGGNDLLNGGEGDDILQGGIGSDQLTGGTGADRFRFDTALSLTNIDVIADFEHGVDRIELSRAVFAALGLGALSANAFGQGTAAQNPDQRIIYDATTGSLYYDADGDGALAAVEFARVAPFTPLDAADIFII